MTLANQMISRTLAGVFLIACGTVEATTRRAPLTNEIVGLGNVIQVYHEHEGKWPKSWDDLEKVTPGLDARYSGLSPTKRMALVNPPIELPGRNPGMAVAISRDAFSPMGWRTRPIIGGDSEYLEDPSYALAVIRGTGVELVRLSPTVAKSIFDKAGSALPAPSGLGKFPYEKEFSTRRIHNWTVAIAFGTWFVWRFIRSRTRRSGGQVRGEEPAN